MDGGRPRHHFRNIVLLWLLANVIMTADRDLGARARACRRATAAVEARGQVVDNIVLLALATPVALGVLVYFGYALWAFRERDPEVDRRRRRAIRGNSSVQFWWLIATTALVLFLAAYGTIRLLADGAGGGQGPEPDRDPGARRTRRRSRCR